MPDSNLPQTTSALAHAMRAHMGLFTEKSFDWDAFPASRGFPDLLRAQMRYADKRLSPAAVILGEDEIAAGQVTVKDLDLGRELAAGIKSHAEYRDERPGQVTVARPDLVAAVRAIVERSSKERLG